jgi:hypothetical protein
MHAERLRTHGDRLADAAHAEDAEDAEDAES